MSKNQPQSKREFRDGVSSKKPARKPQKPVSSSLQRPYRAENESTENA